MTTEPVWPDELFKDLDRTGPVPLYYQIASRLEQAIQDGYIPAGSRLENEISIGKRLGLSRPTVRRSIQELVDKGLLVRRRGIGTQVVQAGVTRPLELTSLYDDLSRTGHKASTQVLSCEQVEADAQNADSLQVEQGTSVLSIRRLRSSDEVPMALMQNMVAPEHSGITSADLEHRGLYEILRQRNVTLKIAHQRIGARNAEPEEARLLEISPGSALLTMNRVAFDQDGRVIEVGNHCYRPDLYSFETSLVAR